MTTWQKTVKYFAIALAILIIATVIAGIVSAALGIIGGLLDFGVGNAVTKEYEYSVDEISELDVDVAAAKLSINVSEEATRISVVINGFNIEVKQDGATLKIEHNDNKTFNKNNNAFAQITLPSCLLDRADIDTGAGTVDIRGLRAKELDLDLGAGKASLTELKITKSADIDTGVGEVSIEGAFEGNTDIDCGIGELTLTLAQSDGGYKVAVSKGLGSVTVDQKSVDGESEISVGEGENTVSIDCGIGSVSVTTPKQTA